MMKKLFWILLLGNVILFAVMQRGEFGWGEQGVQAQPDLNGQMIQLVPAPQSAPAKPLPPPAHVAVSAPIPAPASSVPVPVAAVSVPVMASSSPQPTSSLKLSDEMAAPPVVIPGLLVCLEWGDFSGPDLPRATAALSALQLADKLSQRQIERDVGYWVFIPPLKDKAAVNRKISELKALGIHEYFVIQTSGHGGNAVSLGVFKTRDAAQNFLRGLQAKGVRTAQVGERTSKVKATMFMLDRVDAATVDRLAAMQKDFAGSELNHVPCALTR
jgi:hypothetical protein